MKEYNTHSTFNHALLWTIYIVGITVCFCLLLLLVYSLFFKKRKPKRKATNSFTTGMPHSIKAFSLVGMIFYCGCLSTLLYADIYIDSVNWDGIEYAVTSILWGQANVCTYLLFLSRIYVIFQATVYAEPVRTYIWLCSFCAVTYILQIAMGTLEVLALMGQLSPSQEVSFLNIPVAAEVVCDLIVNAWLISLFIKKLMDVASSLSDDEQHVQCRNSINNEDIEITDDSIRKITKTPLLVKLNRKQQKLMYIATKQTILSTFGTVTTQILLIMMVVMNIVLLSDGSFTAKYMVHLAADAMMIIDSVMNCIAVYLSFSFNDDSYRNVCGCCHERCDRKCRQVAADRIIRATQSSSAFTTPLRVATME